MEISRLLITFQVGMPSIECICALSHWNASITKKIRLISITEEIRLTRGCAVAAVRGSPSIFSSPSISSSNNNGNNTNNNNRRVTEEQLAALFINCGQVVDCHVCGDPNSVLSFAFVEFIDESAARAALSLAGTMLGYYRVRVLPSKTIISPVNPTFLPRVRDTIDFSGIEAVESVVQ